MRLSITSTPPGGPPHSKHVYVDEFGFVAGPSEIRLNATGTPQPMATATERRLLALLYGRAQAHKL